MANMSNSIGTFFWLSAIYIFMKSKIEMPSFADIFFVLIVILFMYFINVNIMQENCGSVNTWAVITSTLLPWIFIFGSMMFGLHSFPWWKTPFSNTLGLVMARFAGCNTAFLKILKPQPTVSTTLHYVYNDPSLLVNRFTVENFDATVITLKEIMVDSPNLQDFKQFIVLKELISEWIWYLLTASVVISMSYNSIMSNTCTKTADQYVDSHNQAMAQTTEKVTPSVYTIE